MRVSLHLTHDCNLRCTYCYGGGATADAMSPETARQAVDFMFQELGDDPCLAVTFFGGEPLLRPDLIETTVARARELAAERPALRLRFAVNTNGTLLTERIARMLQRERFHIFLSIDGGEQTHDTHRLFPNAEGSFFAVARNLRTFVRINPYLATISVITPETCDRVVETVEHLLAQRVHYIVLGVDRTADWDRARFARLGRSYRELSELWAKLHRSGTRVFVNLLDDRIRSHVDAGRLREICNLAQSEFSVAPDGTLFPCVQFVNSETIRTREYAVGHVAEGWYTDARAEIIRQSREQPAECAGCALAERCMNYCGCTNYRTTGAINRVSGFSCAHERLLFPIVDRVANQLFAEKNQLFLRKFYNPNFSLLTALDEILG